MGAFVLDRQFGLEQGFDHYDDDMAGGTDAGDFRSAHRNARRVTDAALSWWQRQAGGPKFLWVHYFDPHEPYEPPGFDPAFPFRPGYDAEISYVDAQLHRLVELVDRETGADTLIILTSDHGEGLGQHGEQTHGLFTYQTTLHVPLIVRFPDHRHAGSVVDAPVSLIDVLPATLCWLGFPSPPKLDGVPLPLPEADGPSAADGGRAVYFENFHAAIRFGWSPLVGVIAADHKLIHAPRPELFDLRQDPHEQRNLARGAGSLARKLTDRLSASSSAKPPPEAH